MRMRRGLAGLLTTLLIGMAATLFAVAPAQAATGCTSYSLQFCLEPNNVTLSTSAPY
jgi:uncharacterized membrane protein YhiD involved in acid resistance